MIFESRLTPSGLFSYHTASENSNLASDLGFWKKASCFGFSLVMYKWIHEDTSRYMNLVESTLVVLCCLIMGHCDEIISISVLLKLEALAAKWTLAFTTTATPVKSCVKPEFVKKSVRSVWTHKRTIVNLNKIWRFNYWLMLDVLFSLSSQGFSLLSNILLLRLKAGLRLT